MDELLLRAEQVATALKIGRSKAYEMMSTGQLPVVRIGRSVRVPTDALRDWVRTHSQDHRAGPDVNEPPHNIE